MNNVLMSINSAEKDGAEIIVDGETMCDTIESNKSLEGEGPFQAASTYLSILKQTNNIVIDNLNQDIKTRKEYIDLAKEKDYFIKCYYFNIGLDICQHLNNLRMKLFNKEKIPDVVYRIFDKNFEYPSLNEGFDEVNEVLFSLDFIDEKHKKEFFMLS